MKHIAVLGSTGSIGTQTLDIIRENPGLFEVIVITANSNWELLAAQALEFKPRRVVIANENYFKDLRGALGGSGIEVCSGADAITESAALPEVDVVVTAMVGYSGLIPTISAIEKGKTIALANKETLVVGGALITAKKKEHGADIVPVDSEHSAIFQSLVGEDRRKMRKILLTASGGPFRKLSKEDLDKVTVADALHHPNWNMGAKVTIDSASMMNKGFEMIEARWLFDCHPSKIEILVHPQSVVHSAVEFDDGSVKAQLGIPDMHLPIRYALGYPERLHGTEPPLSLTQVGSLTFEAPDYDKFPLLRYAFEAIERGGNMPCILNAANEVAVARFLKGEIRFTDMPRIVQYAMDNTPFVDNVTLQDLVETHAEATAKACEWRLPL